MNPNLPTSSSRRQGFYVPSKRTKSPKKEMTEDEITEFYKNQILQKEKEIESLDTSLSTGSSSSSRSSSPERKSVEWKFIKKPSASRLTIEPEGGKRYLFSDRTIEKIVFGDYFLMRYLMKKTQNACFIYPDLMLAVDAIRFIYQLKEMRTPFQSILEDWNNLYKMIEKYPSLVEKYEKTREIIIDNFDEIISALRPNKDGPRLERSNPHYHRLIYSLIERMMEKQRIEFDTSGKNDFMIPYEYRLKRCLQSKKRYIVFFLRLKIDNSYHANMIIIDTKKKTVERFEPHGGDQEIYDADILDARINDYFMKRGYKYISPKMMVCPRGVQDIMESYTIDKYKFSGFCKTWSFLYALLRLHLDEMDQETLISNMTFLTKETARMYFEERHKKTILEEDYKNYDFVIEFLYDYIPNILEEGKEDIKMVNEILGTNIVLEGRMLRSGI